MATTEDTNKEVDEPADESSEGSAESSEEKPEKVAMVRTDDDNVALAPSEGPVAAPTQLGHRRFVYAAYFAGGIGIAFLLSKVVSIVWDRLSQWKHTIPEPREEIIMPAAALAGALAALYYWRRTRARELAEQVAEELSKVTWPSRKEVTNSTFVVIVTTIVSTVFFALMDRFWGFITNLVYGS
jgi:preprotein translocase subunit SecE